MESEAHNRNSGDEFSEGLMRLLLADTLNVSVVKVQQFPARHPGYHHIRVIKHLTR